MAPSRPRTPPARPPPAPRTFSNAAIAVGVAGILATGGGQYLWLLGHRISGWLLVAAGGAAISAVFIRTAVAGLPGRRRR